MLTKVKLALRLTVDYFDLELEGLIAAALADLGIAGISADELANDPLVTRAVITFCRVNFGTPDDYDRLKASYDEQKAQMQVATGYGMPEVLTW